jgi:CheY-like chemotaxis protein
MIQDSPIEWLTYLLLVEDSSDDAFFFKRVIRKSGERCEFKHVWDGGAAIELLAQLESGSASSARLPHIIFLDLKMPVMNGFETLEWIRARPALRNLYVVVLSGSDEEADRRKAHELGASDYFVKPITVEILKRSIGLIGEQNATTRPLNR